MAAPVSWRIKGVNKTTRQMAEDAAARSGLSVGEWLQRAIDKNVSTLPRENDPPLVSAKLLESARGRVREADTVAASPDGTIPAGGTDHDPPPAIDHDQPQLPLLSDRPKTRGKNVPNVSPMLMAADSRRASGVLPRALGGLLVVALLGGAYWLIDWNTKTKMADETDAVAGRSATTAEAPPPAQPDDGDATSEGASPPSAVLSPLERLTSLAISGNPEAQEELGLKYAEGNGVPRDLAQASLWLEKSAAAGMPNAQYKIAEMYRDGTGVSSDAEKSYQWFLKSARQGHVRAQYNLGRLYVEGNGTKRDYAEAARWFTRASRAGLAEAHYSLGQMHEDGLGFEANQREAAAYYRRALAAGSARAATKLTRLEPALKELAVSTDPAGLTADGVPGGPGAANLPPPNSPLSKTGVRKLQTLLKKLDLEPGPTDGLLGAKTREAIRLYQRFAGLPVDGEPTFGLLQDLHQVVGAMSSEQPDALSPADAR